MQFVEVPREEYDAFVAGHPLCNVLQSPAWAEVKGWGHALTGVRDESGALVAAGYTHMGLVTCLHGSLQPRFVPVTFRPADLPLIAPEAYQATLPKKSHALANNARNRFIRITNGGAELAATPENAKKKRNRLRDSLASGLERVSLGGVEGSRADSRLLFKSRFSPTIVEKIGEFQTNINPLGRLASYYLSRR